MGRRRFAAGPLTVLILVLLWSGGGPTAASPAAAARPVVASTSAGEATGASWALERATGHAAAGPSDAPGYPWQWPVDGARHVVEPFRAPAHDYGPGHRGMDVAAASGEPVRAPADGVVAFRGRVVDRPLITIDHSEGFVTTWEPVDATLEPGDVVSAGDVIGRAATGGHAPRGALHIGVRVDDAYVNPRPLFGEVPRAVLLPCCS